MQPVLELEELWRPSGVCLQWRQAERGGAVEPGEGRLWAPQAAMLQVPLTATEMPLSASCPLPEPSGNSQGRTEPQLRSPPAQGPPHITHVLPKQGDSLSCPLSSLVQAADAASPSFTQPKLPSSKPHQRRIRIPEIVSLAPFQSAEGDNKKKKKGYLLIKILSLFPAGYHLSDPEQ